MTLFFMKNINLPCSKESIYPQSLDTEKLIKLFNEFCRFSIFKGNTPATLIWFKNDFSRYCKFLHDSDFPVNLQSFTCKENIFKFFSDGTERRAWKRTTLLNYYKPLKLFCAWLDMNKHISDNPFNRIPQPKVPKSLPTYLTLEETKILLKGINSIDFFYKYTNVRNRAIIYSFIFLGIRKSELLNLKIKDINFQTKIVKIVRGKGLKDRFLPIPEVLMKILLEFKKERERLNRTNEYFFSSTFHNKQMGTHGITFLFKRINEQVSINKKITSHSLRHTFASLLVSNGCGLMQLSKMLGHSSVITTQIYTHMSIEDLQSEIKKHPLEIPALQGEKILQSCQI